MKRVRFDADDFGYRPTSVPGVFFDPELEKFFKRIGSHWLECSASGYLKDSDGPGYKVFYGRAFPVEPARDHNTAALNEKMLKLFPDSAPYHQAGIYPVWEVDGKSKRLMTVEEALEWRDGRRAKYQAKQKKK